MRKPRTAPNLRRRPGVIVEAASQHTTYHCAVNRAMVCSHFVLRWQLAVRPPSPLIQTVAEMAGPPCGVAGQPDQQHADAADHRAPVERVGGTPPGIVVLEFVGERLNAC